MFARDALRSRASHYPRDAHSAALAPLLGLMPMNYPKPQIGYYHSECCLLDLTRIASEADLEVVMARLDAADECGPLMVFANLEEAVACLSGDGLTQEEAAALSRLGWPGAAEP